MVIVAGNGIVNPSSDPEQGCLHFTSSKCPMERHKSIYSPSDVEK